MSLPVPRMRISLRRLLVRAVSTTTRRDSSMSTGWKTLTRRDLTTFDTFATDAVLTAMQLGGVGRIGSRGHATIRGRNGSTMSVSRDTSAPNCQGNVMADLRRTFPELRNNAPNTKDISVSTMVVCPAKGCDQTFPTLGAANKHVHDEHYICTWEGCSLGPDGGPFVGRTKQSTAGHINIRHRGNKPWLVNPEKAAAGRAATFARKQAEKRAANQQVAPVIELTPATKSGTPLPDLGPVDDEGAQHIAPLPSAPSEAEAKLALIQEILGQDPEVVKLRKEVADLKAHLALVREAVGLDFEDGSE